VVSASGEIKPKTYVNIERSLRKDHPLVCQRGGSCEEGQLLAQLENVQSTADVKREPGVRAGAQTDAIAPTLPQDSMPICCAPKPTTSATNSTGRGLRASSKMTDRKSDFDSRRNAWATADAGLVQAKARVARQKLRMIPPTACCSGAGQPYRVADVLQKTTYAAPTTGS